MAVMTSQHPEGVALEQKIQPPVPSSDEMALDSEINGNANRDETDDDAPASKPVEEQFALADVAVNGSKKNDAFTTNNATVQSDPIEPLESQPTQNSSAPVEFSSLPESTSSATTQDQQLTTEPPLQSSEKSTLLESADAAIDSAIDDIAAQSSIPPVIDAQESDLRDLAPPPAQFTSESQEPQNSRLDLDLDLDLFGDSTSAQATIEQATTSIIAEDSTTIPELPSSGFPLASAPAPVQTESHQRTSANLDLDLDLDLPLQPEPHIDSPLDAKMDLEYAAPLADAARDAPPAINDALPAVADLQVNDTHMDDAPQALPTKVAREREDDDENGPAAKRTKTEEVDESLMDTINSSIADPIQNGESADQGDASNHQLPQLSQHEVKEIIKILKNSARTADGRHFKVPVLESFPQLQAQYEAAISQPMDFTTMENKLKASAYSTIADVKADIDLIVNNAITFNKELHPVTKSGVAARAALFKKLANIPPEPTPTVKKEKKSKHSTPSGDRSSKASTARRPSRGSGMDAPTFALNPETNTPLIRRDSTKLDGDRPKRAIHPPKNKDLPYSVKPKSRKFDVELKWCAEVLNEMKKPKYFAFASAFYTPVDPVALGIPTYFNVIKNPMDLSTAQKKLDNGDYANSREFEKDIGLIFSNCYKFNPPPNIVNAWGKQLEDVFRAQLAKKAQWITDHSPAARSHSATPDSDDEESDDEVVEAAPVVSNTASLALNQRLIEEQTKLIDMMNSNGDQVLIQMQRDMVQIVKNRAEAEAAILQSAIAASKKSKKAKPAKSKKAAPVRKPAAAKKSGQKQRYMGSLEKEVISSGIGALADQHSEKILEMIKQHTSTEADDEGNVELDIEIVPVPTLWKIYDLILRYAPEVEREVRRQIAEREAPREPARPAQKKKNKPMSSTEQERKIEHLKSVMQDYERQESGSQEPLPTVETNESSGDESDSEEE